MSTAPNQTELSTRRSSADLSTPVILPFPGADADFIPESPSEASREPSFLEELEMRQDDVLQQLDALDRRITELLNEYVQVRDGSAA